MTTDMFVIYQINVAEKNREYRCRSYAYQIEHGFMITTDNYEISYCGKASQGLVPAKIRENMESLNPDKFSRLKEESNWTLADAEPYIESLIVFYNYGHELNYQHHHFKSD